MMRQPPAAVPAAIVSAHTSPLERPGGAKSGGLNVYVLELARQLAAMGCSVDIFTRATAPEQPEVSHIDANLRAIALRAGPAEPLPSSARDLPASMRATYEPVQESLHLSFPRDDAPAPETLHTLVATLSADPRVRDVRLAPWPDRAIRGPAEHL